MEDKSILRDEDIDWILAQHCYHANNPNFRKIWHDYSPTSNWKEGGELIDRYRIDIKFDPSIQQHPDGNWFGGVTLTINGIPQYITAWGVTALLAAMKALANGLTSS